MEKIIEMQINTAQNMKPTRVKENKSKETEKID